MDLPAPDSRSKEDPRADDLLQGEPNISGKAVMGAASRASTPGGHLSCLGEDRPESSGQVSALAGNGETLERNRRPQVRRISTRGSLAESDPQSVSYGSAVFGEDTGQFKRERPTKRRRLSAGQRSLASATSPRSSHENDSAHSAGEITASLEQPNDEQEHDHEHGGGIGSTDAQNWANGDSNPVQLSSEFQSNDDSGNFLPPRLRGKRPKGWHLRKENRHLRKALFKASPARSERQESVEDLDPDRYEPGGLIKRLPGRRRAPHADPDVEADLRRQLELKVVYRAAVKALKPILAELAERTRADLDSDEELHKEYEGYHEITAELDECLQNQLAVIEVQHRLEEQRLQRMHEAKTCIRKAAYEVFVELAFCDQCHSDRK